MSLIESDKNKLLNFYQNLTKKNGIGSHRSLSWNTKDTQHKRFEALSRIGDLSNKSIVDLGCGYGDLYLFLRKKFRDVKYTGIDINRDFIDFAKEKFINDKNCNFIINDFSDMSFDKADYYFASGAFSLNLKNNNLYFELIEKMFSAAKISIGFNLLDKEFHDSDETFLTYDVIDTYKKLRKLSGSIDLIHDYLYYDFTIFLYK